MRNLSYFFFYTYVGLVVLAGFRGAFIYPSWDFSFLFSMDVNQLNDFKRINLLSQYRFLRALELGFGLFSLYFLKDIFQYKIFNTLFLLIMGMGIMARVFSWLFDGTHGLLTKFFLIYEAIGWRLIYKYTKPKLISHVY
ncbi:DUF4345 family protein [Echinicola sp. CAU 1574]|uniref:DUF4345 family protein n=1 Tax=Echinicola arenosa TaxID=2774144 RepID=A0ABR9AJR0_9BACT|nr:DUF4345 family protein [Echinicola arenosa]MBD8489041.1 DUF4345 family protein [Echinicola arenosa]